MQVWYLGSRTLYAYRGGGGEREREGGGQEIRKYPSCDPSYNCLIWNEYVTQDPFFQHYSYWTELYTSTCNHGNQLEPGDLATYIGEMVHARVGWWSTLIWCLCSHALLHSHLQTEHCKHTEWLPGGVTKPFSSIYTVHVEDCQGHRWSWTLAAASQEPQIQFCLIASG